MLKGPNKPSPLPLLVLPLPFEKQSLFFSQFPLPPSPASALSPTCSSSSTPPSPGPAPRRSFQDQDSLRLAVPPITPLSPNFSRPLSPQSSPAVRDETNGKAASPPLSPLSTAKQPRPALPPPPFVALKPSKSFLKRLPTFLRRPTTAQRPTLPSPTHAQFGRSSSTPPPLPSTRRLSVRVPASPSYASPRARENRMLAQAMLGPANAAVGRDRLSQWRQSVAVAPKEEATVSAAEQFRAQVLREQEQQRDREKNEMGGWKFPSSPTKTTVVKEEENESDPEEEGLATRSTFDLPRTRTKVTEKENVGQFSFGDLKTYSSTPNLALVLDVGYFSPSPSDASPSLLSPTSLPLYASPLSPISPSHPPSSDYQHYLSSHHPPGPVPRTRSPASPTRSARSKLHRITTFFSANPVVLDPTAVDVPRKGLGDRLVVMSPTEIAGRMGEMGEEERERCEGFYM